MQNRNPMQTKRLNVAVTYFTQCFYEKHKEFPTEKQIHLFLALADFLSAKEKGKPMFGFTYKATENGIELIDTINTTPTTDINYLSKEEQTLIRKIAENYDTDAYKQLHAWKKALQREDRIMNYMDEIEDEYLKDVYEGYLEIKELM